MHQSSWFGLFRMLFICLFLLLLFDVALLSPLPPGLILAIPLIMEVHQFSFGDGPNKNSSAGKWAIAY